LIEHYAGAFPYWLAPTQVRVMTVASAFNEYAQEVCEKLAAEGVRFELDDGGDTLGKKIRNAEMMKVPFMFVIGEKEVENSTVAVRDYATKTQEVMSLEDFLKERE
jgi:threonyl-tRNA synthetase